MTAIYASHNGSEDNPQIFDLRMALQYMGALLPERHEMEQFYTGVEDTRGTDGFISWFGGHESREIRRIAKEERDDIDAPMTDYLLALKLKHGRSEDDSKFVGTLLGKCNEHGEVLVEGGEAPTIDDWAEKIHAAATRKATAMNGAPLENGTQDAEDGDGQPDSRPPSSGLSSLGDRDLPDVDMLDT
jgi:transcription initiation factor TFIID subunit 3